MAKQIKDDFFDFDLGDEYTEVQDDSFEFNQGDADFILTSFGMDKGSLSKYSRTADLAGV